MKLIDCNACIGYDTVNRRIVNHENYPVYERVKQAKDAAELLAEMDFNGIDEAVTYEQSMFDLSPDAGNKRFLADTGNYTGRLRGTIAMLPSLSDSAFATENLLDIMQKHGLVGVRAYPERNRYFLDRLTCGDVLDALCERGVPLYLTPMEGWAPIFEVMKQFPSLTVIVYNYGLWGSDRYFYPLVRNYKNLYVDTGDFQELNGIRAFVNKFGSERMLFGTNFPMDNMGGPVATLLGCRIGAEEKENIAHKNIEKLFNRMRLAR